MKMNEMPEELPFSAVYPSGGMEKNPADKDVKQPVALGETPMGKMGPDGDNPMISDTDPGQPHYTYCQQLRASTSADPTPAKPGA